MATVSDEEMKRYISTFHRTYTDAVERLLPADLRGHMSRYQRLPTGVIAYISTQFGAGFEYVGPPADTTIAKGSQRIEDLFFKAPSAVRRTPPIVQLGGPGSSIGMSTFDGAFPFRFSSPEASVALIEMQARSGSWVRDVEYAELFGNGSTEFWTEARAVERAMGEVLGAVVDVREMERKRLDLGEFLARFPQRRVLVLGDFGDGRPRLQAIAEALEALNYLPVFADEIPNIREHDLRQKILLLALTSRFVVIEDSAPAGQLVELPLVEVARKVTIVLRMAGTRSSWMTAGLGGTSRVMREREYTPDTLAPVLTDCAAWAEGEIDRLGNQLDKQFPWRVPG